MTWHLRIWRLRVPTIPFKVDLPGQTSLTQMLSFPFCGQKGKPWCIWGDGLTLDNGLWNTSIEFIPGCFLTSFNLCISNFWAFILHLCQLFSVTDFSGISQCADQQEGGAAELDFSDQGQLHLRSLTLCSLSSVPLLITAHVFPAECKGVTVSLENDACVDLQSKCVMGNLWCSILKGFYHESC